MNRQKHGQSIEPQAWHSAADIGGAGVAVGAAGAAIPAVVKETWPVTERGKGEIPGQAARTVNPTVKARANHLVVGESASVPSSAKVGAATVPSAAVGETTAGVAVEAAGAAILARSMRPKPITERAERRFQARRRGRWSRRPQRSRWSRRPQRYRKRRGCGRSSRRCDPGSGQGDLADHGAGQRGKFQARRRGWLIQRRRP